MSIYLRSTYSHLPGLFEEEWRKYFRVIFLFEKSDWENGEYLWSAEHKEATRCGPGALKSTKEEEELFGISMQLCKPRDGYTVKGQFSSPTVHYVGILLWKCTVHSENPKAECKSDKEIEDAIDKTSFNAIYRQSYFDTQEFGPNPIKNTLNGLYFPLHHSVAQSQVYGVKKNVVKVTNSWFGFGKVESHDFYTLDLIQPFIESTTTNPFQAKDILFAFYFLESQFAELWTRDVYTFFQTLSDLGGFIEMVIFLTSILVYFVQKFYFEQQVIKSLFMEASY
jgi:hypothetical protein